MTQLESHKAEIEAAGLQVVAVGIGEPKHARRYCGKLAPSATCFTNKHTEMHKLYGLRQGTWGHFLNGSILKAAAQAWRAGFRQGQSTGDVTMLPGTFVLDKDGVIQYAYYSAHAGDHPDIAEITAVGHKLTALL